MAARINLVNHQLKAAHRRLDQLCDQLVPPEENQPGQHCEQRDVVILRSMPELGTINLAALLPTGQVRGLKAHEAWQPLRPIGGEGCVGVARRTPGTPAPGGWPSGGLPGAG
jgi:hypothetical protein